MGKTTNMKFVSWNVNGLRAIASKGFREIFEEFAADVFCVQETKLQEGQTDLEFDGYESFWDYARKKGYSGTAVFSRIRPLNESRGIGMEVHDMEGRVVTLDLGELYLVNVYTPNSQRELARLSYRLDWEKDFADYVCKLDKEKPVVVCGDMNVAHQEIDLANPSTNRRNAGFTDEERNAMSALLSRGFVDSYRLLHPDTRGAYSWWSYRAGARARNVGWRIDYFLVSERLVPRIMAAEIHPEIQGSDHCPISLELS